MSKRLAIFLSCCVAFPAISAQTDVLERANTLYEQGEKEQAKSLYMVAAEQGSAEAHFRLAYQYILSDQQSVYHYQQAALQGHQEALDNYLEKVFFRAGSISISDPQSALATYQKAKQHNPALSLYDEEQKVQTIRYAAELPERDVEAFFERYGVKDEDGDWPFYDVWELAEQASREGSVFGKPDPELIFWLITRGGWVPAELSYAVKDYHQHWKDNQVVPFDLCQYVTSGSGMGYCAQRIADKQEKQRQSALSSLKAQLSDKYSGLMEAAYNEMTTFVTLKAQQEEMHGGSGRAAWISDSIQEQKNHYLEALEKAVRGNIESVPTPLAETDKRLNATYQEVMNYLKLPSPEYALPKPQSFELREVQRQWIKHRDATCRLVAAPHPSLKEQCLNWLTAQREQQLRDIIIP
ncbi:DUF1311 domain-containing protein [Vibrio coralliilyticus]|uniref:lysozyme inhibitor LprI family protein n=1 Tax=Vibrio coralliilyticus TaxID=190893 RepID=UPI000BAC2507|nr:lysozyme inhibitor LprI family protein [Vibrio coralliilyticus]NOI74274.1 DUF1311 domain-containing protein [Vibrio coralliilyticus]PAW04874.1 hypothetical protein CKJ79_01195 [Vibrio coralliilyticus]